MPADHITFRTRSSHLEDYLVTDIIINGANLLNVLSVLEAPMAEAEGQPSLAGQYEGLPPLMILPPAQHFFGAPQMAAYAHPGGWITLYEYALSGVPGDWTFGCYISPGDDTVLWDGFANLKRPSWSYDIGPFIFERDQYEEALDAAARNAY
jgi:hypothetical protein